MSSRDWRFRVQDILQAIEEFQRFSRGMTLKQFKTNELVLDAVVRNFEINGMRNILIHEYFGVDVKIVWHTIKKSLPTLQKQLQQLAQQ